MDNLVLIKNIKTDLMGYTGDNFLKKKFYKTDSCYVHKDLVEPLNNIQKELNLLGYQLCIIDAYRPLSVQQYIFNLVNDKRYVSDPTQSRHPRGTAVDVTICELKDAGERLKMPTEFSAFGEKCWAHAECDDESRKNRDLLQNVMVKYGFEIYEYEWWHFDFKGWCDDLKYPALDFEI